MSTNDNFDSPGSVDELINGFIYSKLTLSKNTSSQHQYDLSDVNHIKREVIRNIQKQNTIDANGGLKNQTLYSYKKAEIVLKDLFRIFSIIAVRLCQGPSTA